MAGVSPIRPPVPRGWPRHVRSAVIHVVSLAQASLAAVRGWASHGENGPLRRRAEVDCLQQEIRLLREEIRIKDSRMQLIEAQRRPHYPPPERMAILGEVHQRVSMDHCTGCTDAPFTVTRCQQLSMVYYTYFLPIFGAEVSKGYTG